MNKEEKKVLLDYIINVIETRTDDDFESFAVYVYLLEKLEKEKNKHLERLTKRS